MRVIDFFLFVGMEEVVTVIWTVCVNIMKIKLWIWRGLKVIYGSNEVHNLMQCPNIYFPFATFFAQYETLALFTKMIISARIVNCMNI